MLVDSHCHLDFPDFADDLDAVVARAGAAGLGLMLTINTHLSRFERTLAVAERFANVYCTVGIHPHEAATEPAATQERLVELSRHPKVVGFGETGLDRLPLALPGFVELFEGGRGMGPYIDARSWITDAPSSVAPSLGAFVHSVADAN